MGCEGAAPIPCIPSILAKVFVSYFKMWRSARPYFKLGSKLN